MSPSTVTTPSPSAVGQKPGERGFQSRALSAVDFVLQKMDFGVRRGSVREVVQVFCPAAVVDQNDVREAVFQQTVNDGGELFVRVQGGQNYRYVG